MFSTGPLNLILFKSFKVVFNDEPMDSGTNKQEKSQTSPVSVLVGT